MTKEELLKEIEDVKEMLAMNDKDFVNFLFEKQGRKIEESMVYQYKTWRAKVILEMILKKNEKQED